MSLATRCTTCGTVFRVVQDQLKVSQGWVRCGRCQQVFNALEGLFDLERDAASRATAGAVREEVAPPHETVLATFTARSAPTTAERLRAEFVASQFPPADTSDPGFPSTQEHDAIESRFFERESNDRPAAERGAAGADFADARFPSELPSDAAGEAAPSQPAAPAAAPRRSWLQRRREQREARRAAALTSMLTGGGDPVESIAPPAAEPAAVPAVPTAPEFLRQAERAERWRRPRVRASLAVASLLLAGVLAAQIGEQFHDPLAARWPGLQGALGTLCALRGCQIEAPRQLAALTVESSALTPVEGSEALRLSLTLVNRGATAVTAPAVDLSLTDASGALIARRMLGAGDFRSLPLGTPSAAPLASGSERQWQTLLRTRGANVSGYTVELFYP